MNSLIRVTTLVMGAALTVTHLPAQRSGGNNGGGATGGNATGGSIGGAAGTAAGGGASAGRSSPFPADLSGPIFLSGKVVLDDGTPLPEVASIERLCNGRKRTETRTDRKGYFSFQLGQNPELIPDASDDVLARPQVGLGTQSGNVRESDLLNCEIQATLPGFRSEPILLATHRYMDNPNLGTIVMHRLGSVEGLTTSATSALAPKDARKAYEKGLEAERKSNPDEAQKEFEKAVASYPRYAAAWFELGKIYEQRDHEDAARKAYAQAVVADSRYIQPYERMYMLAVKESKWQEAADTSDRVIRLNPYDFPNAFYINAIANSQLHQLDLAEKSAREAVKLDTAHRNSKSTYVLGIILAQKQNFSEAAENLRAYLNANPAASDAAMVRKQLADFERFARTQAPQVPN